jgi:ribosome recycling factor
MLKINFTETLSLKEFEKQITDEMKKGISFLEIELSKIRTNRAHTSLVEGIKVERFGQSMSMRALAIITVPDALTILIQPFDASSIVDIERAIMQSDIGAQPRNDGKSIKITLSPMSQSRRTELIKIVNKKLEESLNGIRKIRQELISSIKQSEKNKKISEDLSQRFQKLTQTALENVTKSMQNVVTQKEKALNE